jgi:hypothetical protein
MLELKTLKYKNTMTIHKTYPAKSSHTDDAGISR